EYRSRNRSRSVEFQQRPFGLIDGEQSIQMGIEIPSDDAAHPKGDDRREDPPDENLSHRGPFERGRRQPESGDRADAGHRSRGWHAHDVGEKQRESDEEQHDDAGRERKLALWNDPAAHRLDDTTPERPS